MPQPGHALTLPPPDGLEADQELELTPNQFGYLTTVLEGAATQRHAAEAAGIHPCQPGRWRAASAPFRKAEARAWQATHRAAVVKALATVDRLLDADKEHGPSALAEAGRMARWVLEGAGIAPKGGGGAATTVRLELAPLAGPAPAPDVDIAWAELEP